jgi:hypothetical protein
MTQQPVATQRPKVGKPPVEFWRVVVTGWFFILQCIYSKCSNLLIRHMVSIEGAGSAADLSLSRGRPKSYVSLGTFLGRLSRHAGCGEAQPWGTMVPGEKFHD